PQRAKRSAVLRLESLESRELLASTWSAGLLGSYAAGTATTLGVSSNTAQFGQSVTLTAHVSSVAPGAGTPTGQVTFVRGGGGSTVSANRTAVGAWETFTLVDVGPNQVGFRTVNGYYLCAEGGGGGTLVANRTALGPWETFTLAGNGSFRPSVNTTPVSVVVN